MVIESVRHFPPIPKHEPFPPQDPNDPIQPSWDYSTLAYGKNFEKKGWTRTGEQPKSDDDPDWRGVIKNQVQPLPVAEPYNYRNRPDRKSYMWFDTPDYADPFKKLWYATKTWGKLSLAYMCFKCSLDGRKVTLPNCIYGFKKYMIPFFGAGMAVSVSMVTVANLRGKKDDMWNYAVGALVWSGIRGRQNHAAWFRQTVVVVPLFLYIKYEVERNGKIAPLLFNGPHRRQQFLHSVADFKHGLASGDWRFGLRTGDEDPGRTDRREY